MKLHLPQAWFIAVLAAAGSKASATSATPFAAPAFGGTEWKYNTTTNVFENGQTSTAQPGRSDNNTKGPVYFFENVGPVTANAKTDTDTSDGGGIKVTGSDSNVTCTLGRWAGSIYVGEGAILSTNYSQSLKGTEAATAATVYVEGTLNLTCPSSGSDLNMADGGNQNWYIGQSGYINLGSVSSVSNGDRQWNLQVIVSETEASSIANTATGSLDEAVITGIVNRVRKASGAAIAITDSRNLIDATADGAQAILSALDSVVIFDAGGNVIEGGGVAVSDGHLVLGKKSLCYTSTALTSSSDVTWTHQGTAENTLFRDASGIATSFLNGDSVTLSNGATATLATDVTTSALRVDGSASFVGNGHNIATTTLNIYGDTSLSANTTVSGSTYVGGAKTLTIKSGTVLTTQQLRMSEANNSGHVTIDGGTLRITGTSNANNTAASLLLAHWSYGSTLLLKGTTGLLDAPETVMRLSCDGTGTFEQQGGTSKLKGINFEGKGSICRGKVKLSGGRMEVEREGIIQFSDANALELAGGTLVSTWAFGISAKENSNGSVLVSGDTEIDTSGGLINFNAPVSGSGNITKTGNNELNMKGSSTMTGGLKVHGGTLNIESSDFAIASLYSKAATINIKGGSTVVRTSRIELGDQDGSGTSAFSVLSGAKVIVSGSDTNHSGNTKDAYKTTGLLLSEWNNTTTATIHGTLMAKNASLSGGDKAATVVVENGGLLAVKGIRGMNNQAVNVTVKNGGKLILGSGTATAQANITLESGATLGFSGDSTLAYNMTLSSDTSFDTNKYTLDTSNGTVTQGTDAANITLSGSISGTATTTESTTTYSTLSGTGAGVVKLSGTANNITLGNKTQLVGANLGTGTVVFDGTTGYLSTGTNSYGANLVLGSGGFSSDYGNDGDNRTFTGTVSGTGNFTRSDAGTTQTFTFSGDVSQWTGAFKATNNNGYTTHVSFNGGATEVNATIGKENSNILNLTAGADSDQSFSNNITVDKMTISEGKKVAATGTLSASELELLNTSTLKLAQLTATIDTVTLGNGATLNLGTSETDNHESSTLTVTHLELGGNTTLNANLALADNAVVTLAEGSTLELGCSLTLGSGSSFVLAAPVSTETTLMTGVDTLYSAPNTLVTESWTRIGSTDSWYTTLASVANEDSTYTYTLGEGNTRLVYNTASKTLLLTAPEPTTATLSLLALAGLAARRRRK